MRSFDHQSEQPSSSAMRPDALWRVRVSQRLRHVSAAKRFLVTAITSDFALERGFLHAAWLDPRVFNRG
jgi:hypothetical protein